MQSARRQVAATANLEGRVRELERQVGWFRFWFGLGSVFVAGAIVFAVLKDFGRL